MVALGKTHFDWSESSDQFKMPSVQAKMDEVIDSGRELRQIKHKAHNRFLRFLIVNALIWPMLAFVGLRMSEANQGVHSKADLATSGAQALTVNQLIKVIGDQNRIVFWLKALSGDSYTENSTRQGVDVISYLPENTNPKLLDKWDLVIKTYRDKRAFDSTVHPYSGIRPTIVETLGAITVSYDATTPNRAVVSFRDRPQIVTIRYPDFQSRATLIQDAQSLEPIK